MGIKFTPDQQQVIDLHGCNILVSAAAGSGKTAVLVERIVQMVCREEEPVDIDRLLIVTFTNAAAAEMRERISLAISARLEQQPENGHLQRQATLLHNAQITTIDSFCLYLLRNHFNDIGLDPTFRVADQGEIELLRREVMGQMLEERFAGQEEDFFHCVEVYCPNGRETVLEEHILNLHDFAMSQPWPEEWLGERRQDYEVADLEDLESQDWAVYLKKHIKLLLQDCAEQMNRVVDLCQQPDGPYMYGEMAEAEQDQMEKLLALETLEQLELGISGLTFGRLSSKKDDSVNPEKREAARNLRSQVKERLQDIQEKYFRIPMQTALWRMQDSQRALQMLVDLCLEFTARMGAAKQEKKLLDFSDMEHMALQILLKKTEEGIRPTATALEYRDYFAEVLIDEYQDSNLVQEYLLWAVSGEEDGRFNRFMVGDVKQSIYKFRLARPELFLEKYHTYRIDCETADLRRIDLCRNFRSRREVIGTVNQVFEKIMGEQLGGIVYDDRAALHEGAVYPENPGCRSELVLVEKPDKESGLSSKEAEAMAIAGKIRRLRREFQVTDKATGLLRPVQYRDIVVLLRTNSGWDQEFKEVFESQGIPAYISSRTGYFSTSEILQVMQFLKVLDNPLQDVPLFGVLHSVLGGFSDQEVALLRSRRGESGFLYEDLEAWAAAGQSPEEYRALQQKCRSFLAQLEKYRARTAYMPIRKLLQTLFDEYGYLHYVAALPGGEQRLANVRMLLEKAQAFEKTSYYGLYHFIRYMEQLQKYNVDYGEANILDENADVVRIMSIHKSKGLEFPVTIVAGLSKRFNMQDTSQAVILDMDLGIGTDYVDPERRLKSHTLRKNALAVKLRAENLAEEIRVLYVAMTRAKEKLILTGVTEEADKWLETAGKGKAHISYAAIYEASSYLDLILSAMEPTEILTKEDLLADLLREEIGGENRKRRLARSRELVDEELLGKLQSSFRYTYPHVNLAGLYTKTTVSELKMAALEEKQEGTFHAFPEKEVVPYIPGFMRGEEKISGTTRGSAFHKVMELLEIGNYPGVEEGRAWVEQELERLEQEGRLTAEYRQAVSVDKICLFLDSDLAKRMAKARKKGKLWREQPFVYGISADRLKGPEGAFPAEETVLIQGIVDVFFEEEEGLVVADYKTDVIRTPEELAHRYRVQLDYYQEALEHLTGRKVKEKILYSFCLGCEIPVSP